MSTTKKDHGTIVNIVTMINEKSKHNYNHKIWTICGPFMEQLLPIICIHSCDIITTKKLLCVSKLGFVDVKDIWNEKLIYEYPNFDYFYFGYPINLADALTQKNITEKNVTEKNVTEKNVTEKNVIKTQLERNKYLSFHNYCSKKLNEFCLMFNVISETFRLDNSLYEDHPIVHRTILGVRKIQNSHGEYTGVIHLNFRNILNRFAIFESRDYDEWVFETSFSSVEDVKYFLNTTKEYRKEDIVEHDYETLVIDLRGLFPYYASLPNKYELNESGDKYLDKSCKKKWYFYEA
jgi:hypothetical protein